MPTYDYKCNACEYEWELFQSIKANPVRKCPECGKLKARRIIGPGAAILFKGSGFYQTDYRSDSYRKGAKAAEKAQDSSSAKDGSSSSTSDSSRSTKDSTAKTGSASSGSSTAKKSSG